MAEERYFVIKKQLGQLNTSANFSWDLVTNVNIYACVLVEDSGPNLTPSSQYYIALDALRLENTTSLNPLYGLVGYTKVASPGSVPLVKNINELSFIEFRVVIDVSSGSES